MQTPHSKAKDYFDLQKNGYTRQQIADLHGVKPQSVKRQINRYKRKLVSRFENRPIQSVFSVDLDSTGINTPKSQNGRFSTVKNVGFHAVVDSDVQPSFDAITISPSIGEKFEVMHIPTNDCLVFGDMHIPLHNELMLRRALYVCRRFYPHIRNLAIGGDSLNLDFISAHLKNGPTLSTEAELDTSFKVWHDIDRLDVFDHVYEIPGNHTERVSKSVNDHLQLKRIYGMIFGNQWPKMQFHFTDLDYAYLGDKWMIGHPERYNGSGGKLPSEMADYHQRNVISFHNHIIGESQNKNGKFIGIDCGHMTDPDKHWYTKRRFHKYTRWIAGFVVISNGYHYTYKDGFTDWKALGCA